MSASVFLVPLAAVALAIPAVAALARLWLARRASVHANRAALWEILYGFDWGEVTTNNYGFAPTQLQAAERYQLQMYQELLDRARQAGLPRSTRLLEVSCGRGGGLAHLARAWPGELEAVGLDLSRRAIQACMRRHGLSSTLRFEAGSALSLPFPDGAFDVVVNVEASNDYGDYAGFFAEVARVLRPGGLFLYCDTCRRSDTTRGQRLRDAGFAAELEDVTANVIDACRIDAPRRKAILRRAPFFLRLLFGSRLRSYAALPGSRKFTALVEGRRRYLMTCARRLHGDAGPVQVRAAALAG